MRLTYVDTSCLVAIAFAEPGHAKLAEQLSANDRLFSSNLLEAEFRACLAREEVPQEEDALLGRIDWVLPDRSLTGELRSVLDHGYLRGADLWHLACALYLRELVGELGFATADRRQLSVAEKLGL